jgi:hypothetical protein
MNKELIRAKRVKTLYKSSYSSATFTSRKKAVELGLLNFLSDKIQKLADGRGLRIKESGAQALSKLLAAHAAEITEILNEFLSVPVSPSCNLRDKKAKAFGEAKTECRPIKCLLCQSDSSPIGGKGYYALAHGGGYICPTCYPLFYLVDDTLPGK